MSLFKITYKQRPAEAAEAPCVSEYMSTAVLCALQLTLLQLTEQ